MLNIRAGHILLSTSFQHSLVENLSTTCSFQPEMAVAVGLVSSELRSVSNPTRGYLISIQRLFAQGEPSLAGFRQGLKEI